MTRISKPRIIYPKNENILNFLKQQKKIVTVIRNSYNKIKLFQPKFFSKFNLPLRKNKKTIFISENVFSIKVRRFSKRNRNFGNSILAFQKKMNSTRKITRATKFDIKSIIKLKDDIEDDQEHFISKNNSKNFIFSKKELEYLC